jgi:hypothetical protein
MKAAAAALLLALAGCAGTEAGPQPGPPPSPASPLVEVVRDGEAWTAEFRFDRDAAGWVFPRSPLASKGGRPWRALSWQIDTPGVRLERRGLYDLLVADDGAPVPRRVRVRFQPFAGSVEGSYDPSLVFTDGSVALFSEQFDTFPVASAAAVAAFGADLAGAPESRTRVTFRDARGRVLHAGRRLRSVTLEDDSGTYILFGPAKPVVTDAMALVLDPALPGWIQATLEQAAPAMLARYAEQLGPAPGTKPTLLVSWGGPEKDAGNMFGSTLPSLIVMQYRGEKLVAESKKGREIGLWFIAHEAAHFWVGQAVRYQSAYDSWITEGGADLLAVRLVGEVVPGYDARAELQRGVDDCVKLSEGRGVAKAVERNEFRAYYGCGDVFALVAEAASGKPFAQWLRPLIDANRKDGVLTRKEWLSALNAASGDPTLSRDIERLLDKGAADPAAAIASLFARAGVPHRVAEGRVLLQ